MKCEYCDGTGTSNWCINGIFQTCAYCNGTGEVEVVGDSVTDVYDKCGGTGFCEMRMGDACTLGSPCPHQEPLTNEEYIRQCNTEQLAELITDIIYECRDCDDCMDCRLGWCSKDYVVGWLKEKHHAN